MSIRRSLALLAVPAATLALAAMPALAATASHTASSGTEIIVANTAFGPSLAVGSGPFRNFTLYYITSGHGHSFGCTTGATKTPIGPITCTGPSNDKNAEWPAITTDGRPIAGPGVSRALLGRVYRNGVGWQVTYAGHPLYLFDQQAGAVTGEGWDETGLPPWHGVWWLISPSGAPVPWAGTLTTAKIGGQTVLAEPDADRHRLGQLPALHLQRRQFGLRRGLCPDRVLRPVLAAGLHQRLARLHRCPGLQRRRDCPAAWARSPGTAIRSTCSATRVSRRRRTAAPRRWAAATGSRPSAARSAWSPARNRQTQAGRVPPEADPSGFRMSGPRRYIYKPPLTG
jgi:hypothetical protein